MQGNTLNIEKRLLEVRKRVGMTQAVFAKRFGLSPRAYASYELGHRELPTAFVLKLHESLSINPNWLLTGEGSRTLEQSKEFLTAAISTVHMFALEKKIKMRPEKMTELILLMIEYFEQVDNVDLEFANRMLEMQT